MQESFKMEILDVIGVERKREGKTRGSDVKKTRRELQRFKFRHCVLSIYCFALIWFLPFIHLVWAFMCTWVWSGPAETISFNGTFPAVSSPAPLPPRFGTPSGCRVESWSPNPSPGASFIKECVGSIPKVDVYTKKWKWRAPKNNQIYKTVHASTQACFHL